MSKSVRLHHPLYSNCNYVVELPKLYPEPYNCPTCKITHLNKSIHLRLDANGDVFVNEGVLETLKQVGLAGMEIANIVENAPPQVIGAVDIPTLKSILPQGEFYVPGRTKYESSKITEAPFRPILERLNDKLDREKTAKLKEKRSIHIFGKRTNNG